MAPAARGFAGSRGLDAFGRPVADGFRACEPGLFGLGDLGRVEINEAFAVVPLVVAKELGPPEDIVNVEGGAIAHGHPIGATGAVPTTRLLHSMRRDGIRRGLVTLCIGGGRGIALLFEAL